MLLYFFEIVARKVVHDWYRHLIKAIRKIKSHTCAVIDQIAFSLESIDEEPFHLVVDFYQPYQSSSPESQVEILQQFYVCFALLVVYIVSPVYTIFKSIRHLHKEANDPLSVTNQHYHEEYDEKDALCAAALAAYPLVILILF